MKVLLSRVSLTRFLLVMIGCGAFAIIWIVATGNTPSANSVRIETAGAVTGKASTSARQVPTVDAAKPTPPGVRTATPRTLSLGSGQQVDIAQGASDSAAAVTPVIIEVYVTGAVALPGVYALPEGARVQDAIAAAGGAVIQADLDGINLAERLSDEAHVIISRRDDATPSTVQQPASSVSRSNTVPITGQSSPTSSKSVPSSHVNINTATAEELQTLPGIGPSIAARIIADRDQNGPFRSIEDLTRITGIKEGIMAKIRAYLTVGN
jgi:competence protein ComEA